MTEINAGDCRRINHALKVWALCALLGGLENLEERAQETLEAAALLHDIGIHEAERLYGSAAGPLQEQLGPPIAREILEKAGMNSEAIDRVCHLIGHHHTYGAIDGLDFQLLVEADLLVNIDEEGWGSRQIAALHQHFRSRSGRDLLTRMFPAPTA